MTERLQNLNAEEDLLWLHHFGYELTLAARADAYEVGTDAADGLKLRGFNELQHRVYGRIKSLQSGEEWKIGEFLNFVQETSAHFGITSNVNFALQRSLNDLDKQ